MLTAESMERGNRKQGETEGRRREGWVGGILRCPVHYWMCWAMRAAVADVKRKIPVVLLAVEEEEAEVCSPCHYTAFEDVPDREKWLHIKTQLRGECSRLPTVRTDRGDHTACWD